MKKIGVAAMAILAVTVVLFLSGCKMGPGEDWVYCPKCGSNAKSVRTEKKAGTYECTNAFCGIKFGVAEGGISDYYFGGY